MRGGAEFDEINLHNFFFKFVVILVNLVAGFFF